MKKAELEQQVTALMEQTRQDLQTIWDNVNKGQKKQLYKRERIKAILDRYGVEVDA